MKRLRWYIRAGMILDIASKVSFKFCSQMANQLLYCSKDEDNVKDLSTTDSALSKKGVGYGSQ